MAGVIVLLSVALTPAFSSAAGWCPASLIMEKAGLQRASCRISPATTRTH